MPIVITPYREEHEPAVQDFNARVRVGVSDPNLVFFRYATPRWLPKIEGRSVYNEYFIALDNGAVRGGYALKHQNFFFGDGNVRSVGYYHHPLSEGIVNQSYAPVGALLLRDAMQRAPLLYCLGMGGYDRPLPKMLVRLGWSHCAVPFYFKVVCPYRFLRDMQALRSSPLRRILMDLGAFTGTGWLATKAFSAAKKLQALREKPFTAQNMEQFSDWVDPLWQQSRDLCAMTAVRDREILSTLYPSEESNFTRLRVSRNGVDVGWAVVGERRKDAKYGSMRVGSIIDCLALPDHAMAVVRAAVQTLESRGMDLIVSNQSHAMWCRALEGAGFLQAESNFIFAASKKLSELLHPFAQNKSRIHFTRADGDGLPANF
jgi:hypothetical protein